MNELWRRLEEAFTTIPGGERKLLISLAIVAVPWLVRRLILRGVHRHVADPAPSCGLNL